MLRICQQLASTVQNVEQSFIVSYVGYRFVTAYSQMRCSVVFSVTLRLLVINILSSSPAVNTAAYYQRCVTTCETVAVVHRQPCLQHQNRDFCLPHLHSTPHLGGGGSRRRIIPISFGIEKLEWCGYTMVKKFRKYLCFHRMYERDRHTDRQTGGHRITAKAALAQHGAAKW